MNPQDPVSGDSNLNKAEQYKTLEPESSRALASKAAPESVLAELYRDIMYTRGITIFSLNSMVERFLDRYNTPNIKQSADRKNNLMKEVKAESMSIGKFLKNMLLMDIVSIEITVKATSRDGYCTTNKKLLMLDEKQLMKDKD